jgi:cyclopropane fatty-acyl-phospholipid synthase-like methyltransferase
MSLNFNESYFNDPDEGYREYQNYPHFNQRATWIKNNLTGNLLEVGCGYGYLLHELTLQGVECFGIDSSPHVDTKVSNDLKARYEKIDIKDYSVGVPYDWCVSWNVLDCLKDEIDAQTIATKLKQFATSQLHVICMEGTHFTKQGYFIRSYEYWRNLLPNAYLVDYDAKIVHVPTGERKLSDIPLCWGMTT